MAFSKTFVAIAIAAVSTLLLPTASFAAARITAAQAEAAALGRIPGKALSAKYEFEDGRWQYAVLVQQGGALYEVEVNAQNGRVMDSERTTPAEERAEAAKTGHD
ncbi:MAG: PepSY domain-containing protein [Chroococcidiopsidaceae cyanobacterium CP_BM_ER_R8_30]|nr:PepSY domain-containing protein [Chroococcidiopsidaceae cyanobacterium CP_BM_ER_R8_30]